MEHNLEVELAYVYDNFEFSDECSEEMKQEMLDGGFVEDVEGAYVVTDLGESMLGVFIEDESEQPIEEYDEYF